MKFITCNLGCKVNSYETRAISSLLVKNGYQIGDIDCFDIALINTCTVTHVASQKSRQHIRKFRELNKDAIIIAMGCYVSSNALDIIKDCGADIVIGVNNRHHIVELISRFKKSHNPIIAINETKELRIDATYEELDYPRSDEATRAYVKIEDGCDNFCSYCIIPFVRGHVRSRDKEAIFCEIEHLLKDGYKEIVLTGIDTCSYGKEFDNYHFSDLLSDILKRFPNLYRLRISSIEASQIDDKFLDLLKKYKNIANHLHVPLQSGSDTVLKRMNRKYNTKEYLSKINEIRKIRKDIAITTDVIVGFPEESNKEFLETFNFIKKIAFKELHVFPFSPRSGTRAFQMKDLPPQIKKARVKKLIELSKKLKIEYESQFIGKELEVLFESNNDGLTSNYIRVISESSPNEIKLIKLNKSNIKF